MFDNEYDPYEILQQHEEAINNLSQSMSILVDVINNQAHEINKQKLIIEELNGTN